MANEINISLGVQVTNGFFKHQFQPGQIQVTQAAPGRGGHAQLIGTSEEAIDFGDVSTEGYLILRNLDAANFVTYGPQVGTGDAELGLKLEAGEVAIFRITPGSVWRAKADTGAVLLDVCLLED